MIHEYDEIQMLAAAQRYGIPDYMAESLVTRYIGAHIPEGSFLAAILCNDLMEACRRADATNQRLLFNYCDFLYNYAPPACYGSPEKYAAWINLEGASK